MVQTPETLRMRALRSALRQSCPDADVAARVAGRHPAAARVLASTAATSLLELAWEEVSERAREVGCHVTRIATCKPLAPLVARLDVENRRRLAACAATQDRLWSLLAGLSEPDLRSALVHLGAHMFGLARLERIRVDGGGALADLPAELVVEIGRALRGAEAGTIPPLAPAATNALESAGGELRASARGTRSLYLLGRRILAGCHASAPAAVQAGFARCARTSLPEVLRADAGLLVLPKSELERAERELVRHLAPAGVRP